MSKNRCALIIMLMLLMLSTTAYSATLFENNFTAGTGTSGTAVRGGVWTDTAVGYGGASYWEVYSGGPGNRNYLQIRMPSSGADKVRGHSSMGNPSTIYVRFWFRFRQYVSTQHVLYINSTTSPSAGIGIFRGYDSTFSIVDSTRVYYYTSKIPLNEWHRLEYKISNAGGSSGTVLVRLDGVDITSKMVDYNNVSITSRNGALTLAAANYVNVETYDKSGYSGAFVDITGIKVTNDTGWIGGDSTSSADTTPPAIPSGINAALVEE